MSVDPSGQVSILRRGDTGAQAMYSLPREHTVRRRPSDRQKRVLNKNPCGRILILDIQPPEPRGTDVFFRPPSSVVLYHSSPLCQDSKMS